MKNPIAFLLCFAFAACSNEEPKRFQSDDLQEPAENVTQDANSIVLGMDVFSSYAHNLSGEAVLYESTDGTRSLRLKNFTMTNGPDVYVFLSTTNNYSAGNTKAIAILKKEYSNSDLTARVSDDVDLTKYKFVLVYCVQFSSLFGYAEMK